MELPSTPSVNLEITQMYTLSKSSPSKQCKLNHFTPDFLSNLLSNSTVMMCRWLYESQNKSQLQDVIGSSERRLRLTYSATATDYFSTGYCLAQSKCAWKIDLRSVDDVAMEMFVKGCKHDHAMGGYLISASFTGKFLSAEGLKYFLTVDDSLLQNIKHLNLRDNKLDRRACKMLAENVQRMPNLAKLNLRDNMGIAQGGAVQLMLSLYKTKLRELGMTRTGISDPDLEKLAGYVKFTKSLEELRFGENKLSLTSIDTLCKALSVNSSLKRLYMSGCYFDEAHCASIGELLRHPLHSQIEELGISYCVLTGNGIGKVVSGLIDNHVLRELDFNHTQITAEGASAIAKMLMKNSSIERLYLGKCGISNSGGMELGAALKINKTLRRLCLAGNALGDDGAKGLCVGLETNTSLEELRIEDDKLLGKEGVSLLLNCVEENKSLKSLVLPGKFKKNTCRDLQSSCVVSWFGL